ncbi:MAG: N-acetyl-gamma-glutamyl-phosphate reductase [Egibacteraceae bacterium]
MIETVVVGGAGYIGGELLRILLGHPRVTLRAAVSRTQATRRVDGIHPNLRGVCNDIFVSPDRVPDCDALFLASPHGASTRLVPDYAGRAKVIVDLSADFRIADHDLRARYYDTDHPSREHSRAFVPGWPERYRSTLASADRISVPGCMAMAAILALYPLAEADILTPEVVVDARTGSSGSGATAGEGNLHAERSGAMRVFAPHSHRHEAEIAQATGLRVRMSATGVEAVRGVQVLCRAQARRPVDERALRRIYRAAYADEPFVRIVASKRGAYRYPEPKILHGSNFCDVGFAVEPDGRHLVVVAALDNLMKGGAGNAVQCLNIRMGWPERLGLEFPGLHPI